MVLYLNSEPDCLSNEINFGQIILLLNKIAKCINNLFNKEKYNHDVLQFVGLISFIVIRKKRWSEEISNSLKISNNRDSTLHIIRRVSIVVSDYILVSRVPSNNNNNIF